MKRARSGVRPGAQLVAVVVLAFGGWQAMALLLGDQYPVSRFEFFRGKMDTAQRVFARAADGTVHDPMSFSGWACDEAVATHRARMMGADKAALVYMAEHPGPASEGQPLQIFRRTWRFTDGVEEPEVTDVDLVRCTASPTRDTWQFILWQRY